MKNRLSRETVQDTLRKVRALGGSTDKYRFNHEGCPAGEDVRERLYVQITEDRKLLLLHCFNCGKSGAVKYSTGLAPKSTTVDPKAKALYDVRKSTFDIVHANFDDSEKINFPADWPCMFFNESTTAASGFLDHFYALFRKGNGAILLRRGDASNATGYDIRYFPKNFQRVMDPAHEDASKLLVYAIKPNSIAVIVEDPISAMKVAIAGFTGIALCNHTLNATDAFKVGIMYEKLIVWLDNDGEEIRQNSAMAADRLRLYNDNVWRETELRDPKRYTLTDIRDAVGALIK